jgi:hypothetical protein
VDAFNEVSRLRLPIEDGDEAEVSRVISAGHARRTRVRHGRRVGV